jgi:hypothetical protein
MRRLRARLASALVRSPHATLSLAASYLAHDARWPAALASGALDDILARLDAWPRAGTASLEQLALAMEVGHALSHRLGRERTCLERALARYALLRAHGHAPELVVAVAPDATRSAVDAIGHAWVEVHGRPVPHERLAPLVVSLRHPSRARLVPLPGTSSP